MTGVMAALVGAKGGVTLVANMGLDALYHAKRTAATSAPDCTVTLNINGDGTWSVTKSSAAVWQAGTVFSGNWGIPTTSGVGDLYEVSFNNGSTWQTIGAGQSTSITADDTTLNDGSIVQNLSNTVIVRKIGTTTPTSSDAFALRAEDEYTNV